MGLEKLADQEFDAGDVPPHLEDRAVLLCVGKIKRIYRSRTYMLLPNYTCVYVGLVEEQRQTLYSIKRVEVVNALMKPIHAILVLWQAGEDGGAAGGAAADRGEGVAEHQATLGQRAQVGGMDHSVVIHLCLKTCIISNY